MGKPKNYYIRYKRAELENYVKHPESCVKKVHKVERLIFGSNVVNNFNESILRILSRKIGKYDRSLEGVVLDFRNTKVLDIHTGIRYDSAYSVLKVETNFYIFQPRKNAIVDGIVKHINLQKMETIISVVIYRVFNVKVTFKGCIKKCDVHHDKEIKIRINEFHFDNEIPYIEGEMIGTTPTNTRKTFDDVLDSGISESKDNTDDDDDEEEESNKHMVKIKQERESSTEPSANTSNKHAKRKLWDADSDELEPPIKRIKEEPVSDIDEIVIKKEKSDSSGDEYIKKKTKKKKNRESLDLLNTSSIKVSLSQDITEDLTKKNKKKKKKKRNEEDDFESSLQMILNTPTIKKEKD